MMAVRRVFRSALVTTAVDCAVEIPAVIVVIEPAVAVLKVATPDPIWPTEVERVASPRAAAFAVVLVDVIAAVSEPAAVSD